MVGEVRGGSWFGLWRWVGGGEDGTGWELVPLRHEAFHFNLPASRSCERPVALASKCETIYYM